ncbi:MAG: PfkB family carbohydrate kinase [Bryobacteraceae bacterium]
MKTSEILARFPQLSALVIGDICLDRWCTYDPATAEASRETGLSRIGVVKTETTPGAGGTVANNLAALGVGRVSVLGVAGSDGFALELKNALKIRRIEANLLVEAPDAQTFTYTKLINAKTGEEDLPRVDFINTRSMSADVEQQILNRLQAHVAAFDVVLIADQAETETGGVVTARVREMLGDLARRFQRKLFWADSRLRIEHFRNMIIKPNHIEGEAACKRLFGKVDYPGLRRLVGTKAIIVTHGGEGAEVWDEHGSTWVPTKKVESPVDICGAGDSFSAGAAMAMAITGSAVDSARVGNLVASVTIMKAGTGTATPEEVLAADK